MVLEFIKLHYLFYLSRDADRRAIIIFSVNLQSNLKDWLYFGLSFKVHLWFALNFGVTKLGVKFWDGKVRWLIDNETNASGVFICSSLPIWSTNDSERSSLGSFLCRPSPLSLPCDVTVVCRVQCALARLLRSFLDQGFPLHPTPDLRIIYGDYSYFYPENVCFLVSITKQAYFFYQIKNE